MLVAFLKEVRQLEREREEAELAGAGKGPWCMGQLVI
jgi:hypothetical protein